MQYRVVSNCDKKQFWEKTMEFPLFYKKILYSVGEVLAVHD